MDATDEERQTMLNKAAKEWTGARQAEEAEGFKLEQMGQREEARQAAQAEQADIVSTEQLQLEDRLDDLLLGYDLWVSSKVGTGDWTDKDEAFARWVTHGA
jgi:3-phenylpropionate/cinnamic acid dioxygenase small subunit